MKTAGIREIIPEAGRSSMFDSVSRITVHLVVASQREETPQKSAFWGNNEQGNPFVVTTKSLFVFR